MKFKIIGSCNHEFTLILRNIQTGAVMYWRRTNPAVRYRLGQTILDPRTEVFTE